MQNMGPSIWQDTLYLTAGVYEYYFTYNNGNVAESLSDNICTVNNNGTFHRIITVTDTTNVGIVCWEQCNPCPVNVNEQSSIISYVFPNPTSHHIQISTAQIGLQSYQILNTVGQVVMRGQTNLSLSPIDVEKLPSGSYFIRWIDAEHIHQIPFIKE